MGYILAMMAIAFIIFGVIIWKKVNYIHKENRKHNRNIGIKSDGILHNNDDFINNIFYDTMAYSFNDESINGKINILNTEIDNILNILGAKRSIQFTRDRIHDVSKGWLEQLKGADGEYEKIHYLNKIDKIEDDLLAIIDRLTEE